MFGAHVVLYSNDAEADRAFLADVLGFESVDAGGGWLIFGLPPAEVAVHPAESAGCDLFFMCRDLDAELERLRGAGVQCSDVEEARWGSISTVTLPGGGRVGVYQPRHVTMVEQ
jgi:catechol 2,3-dioxygenase-like lactoylglutathione lyase family enzyme